MTVTLAIQFLSTLGLLAAGFWSRRRDRREISRLASELAACRSALHEFMQETEATFAVFSHRVHKTEPSNGTRVAAPVTNRILSGNNPAKAQAVAAPAKPAPAAPARGAAGKKTQVLKLAGNGMAPAEIASQLTIPQGEIDLILNLNGRVARC